MMEFRFMPCHWIAGIVARRLLHYTLLCTGRNACVNDMKTKRKRDSVDRPTKIRRRVDRRHQLLRSMTWCIECMHQVKTPRFVSILPLRHSVVIYFVSDENFFRNSGFHVRYDWLTVVNSIVMWQLSNAIASTTVTESDSLRNRGNRMVSGPNGFSRA